VKARDYDIIIVGAGLAGSSVAWHLARLDSSKRIVVIEREHVPGSHASSQNAAMIRSLVFEDALVPFAIDGTLFWNELPHGIDRPGAFRRVGSLLLASHDATLCLFEQRVEQARARGLHPEILDHERCRHLFPALAQTPFLAAAYSPEDGVADPLCLVEGFLRGARQQGAELRKDSEVVGLLSEEDGTHGVRLADGQTLHAPIVVLAAGAWVPQLMEMAGLRDVGLRPHRRHLFHTSPCEHAIPGFSRKLPYVWHIDLPSYFRWEAGGALFCACDEDPAPPGRPEVDPKLDSFVENRLRASFPCLLDLPIARSWAGLRTYTPSQEFLLGEDPSARGWFYAAGLGGHGVTCASPAGQHAAKAILGQYASC